MALRGGTSTGVRTKLLMSCAIGITLALTFVACENSSSESFTLRRDSAGVRIVESTRQAWAEGEGWTVDPVPVLDLTTSGQGPAHEFYRVRDAIRLRDGSFAVANYGSAEIRLFSAAGQHIRTYGRQGEGPGEFERLTSIHELAGDSILAFDYWLGRFTIFDIVSGEARTFGSYDKDIRIDDVALLQSGRIVTVSYVLEQLVDFGVYRMPHAIATMDMTGGNADSVAVIPGGEGFQFDQGDARPLFRKDGMMAVHGERIYLGHGDSLEVSVYAGGGELEMIMRVPGHDLRLSDADIAAERQALAPRPEWPDFMKAVNAALPAPETRPAYAQILVDAGGFVWAPEHLGVAESEQPLDCTIFSPDGQWLGSVQLPPRFTPYEIGEDYVLGMLRDDLDTEHVQVLRLDRNSR